MDDVYREACLLYGEDPYPKTDESSTAQGFQNFFSYFQKFVWDWKVGGCGCGCGCVGVSGWVCGWVGGCMCGCLCVDVGVHIHVQVCMHMKLV